MREREEVERFAAPLEKFPQAYKELEGTVTSVAAPIQTEPSEKQVAPTAPVQQSSEPVVSEDPPVVITEVHSSSAVNKQPDLVGVVTVKAKEPVTETNTNWGDKVERTERNSQSMDYESSPPALDSNQLGEGNDPTSVSGIKKGENPT